MRRALTLTALAVTGLLVYAGAAAAAPPAVSATIDGAPGAAGWYVSDVVIHWSATGATSTAGCEAAVSVQGDTAGTTRTCTATNASGNTSVQVVIRIDATPPTATAATPARGADHGGWFTQPVTLAWSGADATSGIAGCTRATYAGPDGPAATLSGSCTDRAGNVSAPLGATFAYDATPPVLGAVTATAGEGMVRLRWAAAPDAVAVHVTRSPGRGAAAASAVYDGTGTAIADTGLVAGTRYTYALTAADAAGNVASATVSAVPSGPLLAPAPGATLAAPPGLRWRTVRRARYYNVQVFRGRQKVLSAWPSRARLTLRRRWTYGGRTRRLAPGRYRWYVWPGYGPRSHRHYGRLLGHRTFVWR